MKPFFYLLSACAVMGLAYWAYRENYQTHRVLKQITRLRTEIVRARGSLSALRADWAYLNRPDRLRDLVEMNFADLRLMPMTAQGFGRPDQVAFPPAVPLSISGAVDVVASKAAGGAR